MPLPYLKFVGLICIICNLQTKKRFSNSVSKVFNYRKLEGVLNIIIFKRNVI